MGLRPYPPWQAKGGAGSGRAKPVPPRLLGVRRLRSAAIEAGFDRAAPHAGGEGRPRPVTEN